MCASPELVIKDKETRVVLLRDRWAHKRSVRSSVVVTAAMEHVSAISACRKCMVSSSIVIITGIGKKPVGA